MKRLLIISTCLLFCTACFADSANTAKKTTTITVVREKLKDKNDTLFLSDVYTSNVKYVYGDKDGNHGGTEDKNFKRYVVEKQNAICKDTTISVVARDEKNGPYIVIMPSCKLDTIEAKFPFEKGTYAQHDDILCLKIIIKDYQKGNVKDGESGTSPEPNDGGADKIAIWEKIKSSYSPYWIIILIDWLVLLCIVVLMVYILYVRNKKTVTESSDDYQEKVNDKYEKKGKQRRSQKEDNRDEQLEGFKNLIVNEMKNVSASQENKLVSLKTDLLKELANFKDQIQVIQKNADKTTIRPTRTIVSSQSKPGIGTNSANELDTKEVDFLDGKMVIVKDSQYKYFRLFSEKGRFYYTQNPDYGIETWASDYNNLTDAMTITNPYDSQNSHSIKIVKRGQLTKVSDDTFEIAEKLVLEFV